jgi:hypothetical protein
MARYFKENVLYFFGNYYPRISLKDVEENHEGLRKVWDSNLVLLDKIRMHTCSTVRSNRFEIYFTETHRHQVDVSFT